MRWIIYFAIGIFVHVKFFFLPIDLNRWIFWFDLFLWPIHLAPFIPDLIQYLPTSIQNGLGLLLGVCAIGGFIMALNERNNRRW